MSQLRRFEGVPYLALIPCLPPPSLHASSFLSRSTLRLPSPGIASTLRSLSALNREERSMADSIASGSCSRRPGSHEIALDPLGSSSFAITISVGKTVAEIEEYRLREGEEHTGVSLIIYGLYPDGPPVKLASRRIIIPSP